MDASVSVIIPVFNEHHNPTTLTQKLWQTLNSDSEIIFIDDHSTDETWHEIQRLASLSRDIPVRGYRLATNRGQSAALQAGLDHASNDIVVTMDGDLQNDPQDIPKLVGELEQDGVSCAYGYRENRHDSFLKTIPSRIQTVLLRFGGPDLRDYGCGMKALDIEAINCMSLYGEQHRYIPFQLAHAGHAITEVKVNHNERENNSSKYGMMRLYRGFLDYVYWVLQDRYQYRPLHWLGGLGLLLGASGFLLGFISVLQKYLLGVELTPRTPRLVLISLLILSGLLLFCFGFIAESITQLQVREQQPYQISESTSDT